MLVVSPWTATPNVHLNDSSLSRCEKLFKLSSSLNHISLIFKHNLTLKREHVNATAPAPKLSGCALNYQHQGFESTLNDLQ